MRMLCELKLESLLLPLLRYEENPIKIYYRNF
jgi:hypothetical protein